MSNERKIIRLEDLNRSHGKLIVPEHVAREREAQLAFEASKKRIVNAKTEAHVARGYRVEELQLEEYPDASGDPLRTGIEIGIAKKRSRLTLALRRWYRRRTPYEFAIEEGRDA